MKTIKQASSLKSKFLKYFKLPVLFLIVMFLLIGGKRILVSAKPFVTRVEVEIGGQRLPGNADPLGHQSQRKVCIDDFQEISRLSNTSKLAKSNIGGQNAPPPRCLAKIGGNGPFPKPTLPWSGIVRLCGPQSVPQNYAYLDFDSPFKDECFVDKGVTKILLNDFAIGGNQSPPRLPLINTIS